MTPQDRSDGYPAVELLLARDDIRQLSHRYADAIQRRDVDAMVALFVPHARFGSYGAGPDALRHLMTASMEGSVFAVIMVANHLINLSSEGSATGQVWAHCFAQTEREGFVEQLIRYDDSYERYDGGWRFLRRRHRLWYGVTHEKSPLRQRGAGWPASQVGVGDLLLDDPLFLNWWQGEQ